MGDGEARGRWAARKVGIKETLGTDAPQILEGFRRIRAGERVFSESHDLIGARRAPPELSARQQEVYDALIGGLSNKQIARKLSISEHTVKDHVTAVLSYFGARNRLELLLLHQRPPLA